MLNKLTKISITILIVCLLDISYAFKIPGGLQGSKKSKKPYTPPVAYTHLFMPSYDRELDLYGVINRNDLSIAGAPAVLKVIETQIMLAKANKLEFEALCIITDILRKNSIDNSFNSTSL